jgi:hypothetical protein
MGGHAEQLNERSENDDDSGRLPLERRDLVLLDLLGTAGLAGAESGGEDAHHLPIAVVGVGELARIRWRAERAQFLEIAPLRRTGDEAVFRRGQLFVEAVDQRPCG